MTVHNFILRINCIPFYALTEMHRFPRCESNRS